MAHPDEPYHAAGVQPGGPPERPAAHRVGWRPLVFETTLKTLPRHFNSPDEEIVFLLRSIRKMLIFFIVLAILGIVGGIIGFAELIHAANSTSGGGL